MTDPVHLIPLSKIDEAALTRDHTGLDPEPMAELERSIAASGLRQPIELFPPFPAPWPPPLRPAHRLPPPPHLPRPARAHGPAPLRRHPLLSPRRNHPRLRPRRHGRGKRNEIRADLSPFERGLISVTARDQGAFASIEEAVEKLHPNASKQKRLRLRTLAFFAEEMAGQLTAPEKLSQAQAFRVSHAISAGFGELIRTALDESSLKALDHQWELLKPILAEADEHAHKPETSPHPARPRRILRPRYALTVRRERTRDGWSLHFTGREASGASGAMMDLVLDEIERMYAPV